MWAESSLAHAEHKVKLCFGKKTFELSKFIGGKSVGGKHFTEVKLHKAY